MKSDRHRYARNHLPAHGIGRGRPKGTKQERRRWCKGKPGVDHRWALQPLNEPERYRQVLVAVCGGCGRTQPSWMAGATRSICRECGSDWPRDVGVTDRWRGHASHCHCGADGSARWRA